jgi:GT2 family glycosyltransferase
VCSLRTTATICVVTVTYGGRSEFVKKTLNAAFSEGIHQAVVVDNGASWDVTSWAREVGRGRVNVVRLGTNLGSAAGFAAGIKRACELGAEFIWLLDDDNQPGSDALSALLAAYADLSERFAKDSLAVLAFRPDHQRDLAAGVPLHRLRRRHSSFLGFHLFDVPYKIWRRTPWGRPRVNGTLPPLVEMDFAPYGGLLFHRDLVERHGLPQSDFVLYADDTEFTFRITHGGGAIRLVTAAGMADLEASWRVRGSFGSAARAWLNGASDTRIFYGARNQTYLDSHALPHERFLFWVNRRVYCLALWAVAVISRRTARYRLLQTAIEDGLAGRLGAVANFPL